MNTASGEASAWKPGAVPVQACLMKVGRGRMAVGFSKAPEDFPGGPGFAARQTRFKSRPYYMEIKAKQ